MAIFPGVCTQRFSENWRFPFPSCRAGATSSGHRASVLFATAAGISPRSGADSPPLLSFLLQNRFPYPGGRSLFRRKKPPLLSRTLDFLPLSLLFFMVPFFPPPLFVVFSQTDGRSALSVSNRVPLFSLPAYFLPPRDSRSWTFFCNSRDLFWRRRAFSLFLFFRAGAIMHLRDLFPFFSLSKSIFFRE